MDTLSRLALGAAGCWLVSRLINRSKRPLSLPPGPPSDPIIGHLRVMPTTDVDVVFHEWAKQYGDVVHVESLGRNIIILDSDEAAVDLLEKRGTLYSDRPDFVIFELMGWNPDMAFLRYGDQWRFHRKLLHSHFTEKAILKYQPLQQFNAYLLAQDLMENKGNFDYLFSKFSTAIIIRISYGHQIVSDEDEYIEIAHGSGQALRCAGPPASTFVDLFPILKHFPSWFPGTHFANVARQWRWAIDKLYCVPFDRTMKQIAEGAAPESFLSEYMASRDAPLSADEVVEIRGAAAVIYGAGAETTWSSLTTFVMAMLLHPECQKLAQEEVDRVVGEDRLPTFDDRASLPYVNAIIQEVSRWSPVVPLGVAHRATHDDIYRNMFIPKGSLVIANARGMSRDENVYKDPEHFNPSRFLPRSQGGDEEPPFGAAFGYGRRICPGRHLALSSLYIAIATIFSALHLSKAKDEDGNEITPKVEFVSGLTSHPKPFPCHISPRSDKKRDLIREAVIATE